MNPTPDERLKEVRDIPHFGRDQMLLTANGVDTVRLVPTPEERKLAVEAWCEATLTSATALMHDEVTALECKIITKKAALSVLELQLKRAKERVNAKGLK